MVYSWYDDNNGGDINQPFRPGQRGQILIVFLNDGKYQEMYEQGLFSFHSQLLGGELWSDCIHVTILIILKIIIIIIIMWPQSIWYLLAKE